MSAAAERTGFQQLADKTIRAVADLKGARGAVVGEYREFVKAEGLRAMEAASAGIASLIKRRFFLFDAAFANLIYMRADGLVLRRV
jgi:hypothetical protein